MNIYMLNISTFFYLKILHSGASIDSVSREGHTPFSWAQVLRHHKIAFLLRNAGDGTLFKLQ